MFEPSAEWTEEERLKVIKDLMEEIRTYGKDPYSLVTLNYMEYIGKRLYYLALGDPGELEKRREFILHTEKRKYRIDFRKAANQVAAFLQNNINEYMNS